MDSVVDRIDFNSIKGLLGLKSKKNLSEYLKKVYADFYTKDKMGKILGMSKVKFIDLIKLPIFICDKFFYSINKGKSDYLTLEQLTLTLCQLYFGNLEETAEIIFDIYDFNHNGKIFADDIKAILSFLPLKEDKTKTTYKYQLESLDELDQILSQTFRGKSFLNFEDFFKILKYKSDIFLQLLCYLYQRCPFKDESLKMASRGNSGPNTNKSLPIVTLSKMGIGSKTQKQLPFVSIHKSVFHEQENKPKKTVRHHSCLQASISSILSTPSVRTNISCVREFILDSVKNKLEKFQRKQRESLSRNISKTYKDRTPICFRSYFESAIDGVVQLSNIRPAKKSKTGAFRTKRHLNRDKGDRGPILKRYSLKSTTNIIKETYIKNLIDQNNQNNVSKKDGNYNTANIELVDFPENDDFESDEDDYVSEDELFKNIILEGPVCVWSESKKIYKDYWLVLVGNDLYYYDNHDKKNQLKVKNILGCFIKENEDALINKIKHKSFSIIFRTKTRKYFVKSLDEGISWVSKLREALHYKNLFDSYEMLDDIGSGSYGTIKLGVDLKTKIKVAIKIVQKSKLTKEELNLVATEIDVLKFCKHPNIINFLDHFENSEYIFIIMEYIKYGDLGSYTKKLKKEKVLISEEVAARIAIQMADGLNYLHRFGIVHRDLKMENIMISKINNNQIVEIKILDFGLSKIIGPNEKSGERYGTLFYLSPEICVDQPHNKSTDIWSFGILVYFLLAGEFPFDDDSKNKKTIAKKIVNNPLEFPAKRWQNRSKEVMLLIDSCLQKDMNKRITTLQILKSDWFKLFIKK